MPGLRPLRPLPDTAACRLSATAILKQSCCLSARGRGRMRISRASPSSGLPGICSTICSPSSTLTAADYYITNIVKCRPPQNRDPLQTLSRTPASTGCGMQTNADAAEAHRLPGPHRRHAADSQGLSASAGSTASGSSGAASGSPPCIIPPLSCGTTRKSPETFYDLKSLQYQLFKVCPEIYAAKGIARP